MSSSQPNSDAPPSPPSPPTEDEATASIEPGSSSAWVRTGSELEIDDDAPSSPSSSGYAGEQGSTSATSGSGIEIEHEHEQQQEIEEEDHHHLNRQIDNISISDSHTSWIPGKRNLDEVGIALIDFTSVTMNIYMLVLIDEWSAGWCFVIMEEKEEAFLHS